MTYHPYRQPEFSDEPPRCAVCGKKAEDPVHNPGSEEDMSDNLKPEDLTDKAVAWDAICEKNRQIETLQQRCEELAAQVKTMTDVANIYSNDWNSALEHIAALEAALITVRRHINRDPIADSLIAVDGPTLREFILTALRAQALTSSEGAGEPDFNEMAIQIGKNERLRGTIQQDGPLLNKERPIHSPTSAGEGREDG